MKFVGKILVQILLLAVLVATIIEFQEPLQQKWQEIKEGTSGITLLSETLKQSEQGAESASAPIETGNFTEGPTSDGLSYYGYNQLSDLEKLVYRQFLAGVQEMRTGFEVGTEDTRVVDEVYNAILADHPELFWLGGYTVVTYMWGDEVTGLKIEPEYFFTEGEKTVRQAQIEEIANGIVKEALAMYNEEYGQVRYIYEKLIQMTEYDLTSEDNQNISSVFLHQSSVCMGYAKSFQYLVQKLGLECTTISGKAGGDTHAWNLIFMEEEYYFVDATWGDMNYSDPKAGGEINYLYFGMSTKDLEKNHTSNMEMELPVCVAEGCNYYAREGLLYTGFDSGTIGGLIWDKYAAGEPFVTIRFRNQEAYEQAKNHLFEESKVFDYCEGASDIRYVEYDEYFALTIYFKGA